MSIIVFPFLVSLWNSFTWKDLKYSFEIVVERNVEVVI